MTEIDPHELALMENPILSSIDHIRQEVALVKKEIEQAIKMAQAPPLVFVDERLKKYIKLDILNASAEQLEERVTQAQEDTRRGAHEFDHAKEECKTKFDELALDAIITDLETFLTGHVAHDSKGVLKMGQEKLKVANEIRSFFQLAVTDMTNLMDVLEKTKTELKASKAERARLRSALDSYFTNN